MDKKAVIKALTDHFGLKPKYMGAPSFAYQFESPDGVYMVDKAGTVTNPEGKEVELKSLLSGSLIDGVSDLSAPFDPVVTADLAAPSDSEAPNGLVNSDDPDAPDAPAAPDHPVPQESSVAADVPSDSAPPDGVALAEPATSADVDPAESVAPADSESYAEPAAPSDQAEPSITNLEITAPMGDHTGLTLRNLTNLIYSRQALMAKALGYNGNIIEDAFITAIHDRTVDTSEKLMEKIAEVANLCPGIGFDFDSSLLTFKFFQGEQTAEKIHAYTQLVELLNHTAQTLKYASSKSKETDNDKFTFRLFLIRLGFVGSDYKLARKILLDRLEGNSAFRNGSKLEKTIVKMV